MPYNPEVHHRRSIRLRGYDYAQAGAYTAAISVTDGAANTATTNRTVNVGSAPPAAGPSSGPAPLPPVTGLPDPVLGKTANVLPLKPVVRIKVPRAKKFVALTRALR